MGNQIEEVKIKAEGALAEASRLSVVDRSTYEMSAGFLMGLKSLMKSIDDTFDPIIESAHRAHKEAVAAKKKHAEPVQKAEATVKGKMSSYAAEEERKRIAEEKRLQEDARRREEEIRIQAAIDAEAAGEKEAAEAIIAAPVIAPIVVVKSEVPKMDGISHRSVWKFRISDETKIPREYLKVDEVKIGGVVRSMKGMTAIPGVEVYEEKVISAGRMA